jgi:hypothetical protein
MRIEMLNLLSDFASMREFTKKSSLKFADALLEYYKQLGERQGFTVAQGSSIIKNAYNFGKIDLMWVEPNVVFSCEFGVFDDIYRHLWKISAMRPAHAVLLLSQNSQCSPQKVKELVAKSPQLKGIEFMILDVTGGKVV